jgi:hypothetical protein
MISCFVLSYKVVQKSSQTNIAKQGGEDIVIAMSDGIYASCDHNIKLSRHCALQMKDGSSQYTVEIIIIMSRHCVLQLKDGSSQYTVEIIIIPI